LCRGFEVQAIGGNYGSRPGMKKIDTGVRKVVAMYGLASHPSSQAGVRSGFGRKTRLP
jgi:hypothetical protein